MVLKPGQTIKLHARLFDDKGRFLREEKGHLVARRPEGNRERRRLHRVRRSETAGLIKATSAALKGEARARVVHPLPWTETFEEYQGRRRSRRVGQRDRRKIQSRDARRPEGARKRLRMRRCSSEFACLSGRPIGPIIRFEADVRVNMKRRQMGDIGITAQRYSLVLYGNEQKLKIEPWEPEIQRTRDGAFRMESGHLVSPEISRRKYARREGPGPGKSVAAQASRSRRHGRSRRSIRSAIGKARRAFSPIAQFGVYLDNLKLTAN